MDVLEEHCRWEKYYRGNREHCSSISHYYRHPLGVLYFPFLIGRSHCFLLFHNKLYQSTLSIWYEVANPHLVHKLFEDRVLLLSPLSLPELFKDVALMCLETHESCPAGLTRNKARR